MVRDVDTVVGPDGWTTWDRLVAQLSPTTVRAWVAAGRLVHLDTGVYASPRADWRTRVAAVARHRRGVVSHVTALALWGLVPDARGPVHLTVPPGRSGRGTAGVVLHRGRDVDWHVRRVAGMPVTSVERSLVDAWGSAGDARSALRGAVIDAVRDRRCSVGPGSRTGTPPATPGPG